MSINTGLSVKWNAVPLAGDGPLKPKQHYEKMTKMWLPGKVASSVQLNEETKKTHSGNAS